MVDDGNPMFGAQATCLTQSVCVCSRVSSGFHEFSVSENLISLKKSVSRFRNYLQILTKLSQPPETSLFTGGAVGAELDTREPAETAGAQQTAFTPIA